MVDFLPMPFSNHFHILYKYLRLAKSEKGVGYACGKLWVQGDATVRRGGGGADCVEGRTFENRNVLPFKP
jgi:hypothetical protein